MAVLLALVAGMPGCQRATAPEGPLRLRVVGEEFEWHVRHPGADGRLDTGDDVLARRDLHLPVSREVELEVRSEDYIYGFRVPDVALNVMAVPDLSFQARLRTDAVGRHALRGDQMCGYAHESLLGQMVVHSSVKAGDQTFVKVHDGESGYLGQSAMPLYFGLGDATSVDEVSVAWLSGVEQKLGPQQANPRIEITEPK